MFGFGSITSQLEKRYGLDSERWLGLRAKVSTQSGLAAVSGRGLTFGKGRPTTSLVP